MTNKYAVTMTFIVESTKPLNEESMLIGVHFATEELAKCSEAYDLYIVNVEELPS